ncbi:hypothetical protein CYY_001177 [Polysphondylium violaceum]|uniref:Coiled-coil domain-containing protein 22 homolog n=1 Tax=Polysphondylium violaceum TaxID=133409 RepID=A0A8J4Q3Q5_9MYCE|nr:hypothetical protein CYY_001177 [Polysphondylium violaceum]
MHIHLSEIEDNTTIKDLDTDLLYKCILAYLKVINENKVTNLTSTLPKNMSSRVNSWSLIANLIKDLGYRADLSFHNLLYPNINDTRRILIFLGQNLPKKEIDQTGSGGASTVKIEDQICLYLQGCIKESWMPYFCPFSKRVPGNYSTARLFTTQEVKIPFRGRQLKVTPGLEEYFTHFLPPITNQPNRFDDLAPSVFEYNLSIYAEAQERDLEWKRKGSASGLNPIEYKKQKLKNVLNKMNDSIRTSMMESGGMSEGSRGGRLESLSELISDFRGYSEDSEGQFSRKKDFTNELSNQSTVAVPAAAESTETEEERQAKRQAEIDRLQEQLNQLSQKISSFARDMENFAQQMRQQEALGNEQDQQREGLEKAYKIKKKTFSLLDDAEGNTKELQALCNQTSANILEMSGEWEKVRKPIIEKYRSLKDRANNEADEAKSKLDRIKEMRALIRKLVEEVQQKEELFQQLQQAYKEAPKDANRSIYTLRILETVKNIKKQKVDIDKVLLDTKNLQKDINSITDTAVRTFDLVKDLLYNDAKKDPIAKQAIKSFAVIDEKFQKLFKVIDETGSFQNNVLTLESKIDYITVKTNTLNSDRIVNDLKNVKTENQNLIKTIKSKMQQE